MQLYKQAFVDLTTSNELEITEDQGNIEFRINTDDGSTLSVDLTRDDMKNLVLCVLNQFLKGGW